MLGYPAEIVPLTNPYALRAGEELRVRCLVDGEPVTDGDGVARFTIDRPGKWYVKFTNLARVDAPALDYESKWATLTFEVR